MEPARSNPGHGLDSALAASAYVGIAGGHPMPEPPSPGLPIEEAGPGPRPIEGVATATAAFLGATERGPTTPLPIASLFDYQRSFGGAVAGGYMPDAVAGFFANGGRSAVVVRIVGEGGVLSAADYEGAADAEGGPCGLAALDLDDYRDVALVYAPDAHAVTGLIPLLIAHCERSQSRFAVIDAPRGTPAPLDPRAAWDTSYAAFYYPWLQVHDAATGARRLVPPGGHVLGVYARTDVEQGVFKAPANEALSGVEGLEFEVAADQQEPLNAAGVNTIRAFPGRGVRVWGARTLSSDGQWKYVSVRRLFIFLERSIYLGTQWVVFEPNGERLWARVADTVRLFLRAQWRAGALLGRTESEAFFVRCDRTSMTQDDIDNGRLVCTIGVAPVRPAEFVIFHIGQWTADREPPP